MNHELFVNFEHQKRFMELRQQLKDELQMDNRWLPMIFLIAGNKELEQKVLPSINFETGELNDDALISGTDSETGQNILLRLAIDFYTGENTVFANELTKLDRAPFDLALAAIRIRHKIGWYQTSQK